MQSLPTNQCVESYVNSVLFASTPDQLVSLSSRKEEFLTWLQSNDNGIMHCIADKLEVLSNTLQNSNADGFYLGLNNKLPFFDSIVQTTAALDSNGGTGILRLNKICKEILTMSKKEPHKFTSFVAPELKTFIESLDKLVNSKNHLEVATSKETLQEQLNELSPYYRSQAFKLVRERSSKFIGLVNDASSSFSELNDQLAAAIVTCMADVELLEFSPPATKDEIEQPQSVSATNAVAPVSAEQTPEFSFIPMAQMVSCIMRHSPGSKEYAAKKKFFLYYIANMYHATFDDFLQNAAQLVLTGSHETVKLANSLLKR